MPEKVDFIQVVDLIFKNRSKYKVLSDEDKINTFFMVNRKFAVKYIKEAEFLNNKFIDKASALDTWYNYFSDARGIPGWYWSKSTKEKEKIKKIPSADKQDFIDRNDLNENDYNFLEKHFKEEVEEEIKKIKKYV
jgi:hypothetical protein